MILPRRIVHTTISSDVCSQVYRTEEQVYVNGHWETTKLVEEEITTPIFSRWKDTPEYIRARKVEYL